MFTHTICFPICFMLSLSNFLFEGRFNSCQVLDLLVLYRLQLQMTEQAETNTEAALPRPE